MLLKAKDYATAGNVLSGYISILFSMTGHVDLGGLMLIVAFVCDLSDGLIARLTKTHNKFGSEFDNIADLVSYSIAPSFIVYASYRDIMPGDLTFSTIVAGITGALPALFGCIRFARFNVKRIEYPGVWIGLPRPVSALIIMAMTNSYVFLYSVPVKWAFIPVIILMAFMNISLIPYLSHHNRKMPFYQLASVIACGITVIITVPLTWVLWGRPYLDGVTAWLLAYFAFQYLGIPKADRKKIKEFAVEWRKE